MWNLTQPLQDINIVFIKLFVCSFGFMLRLTVLLANKSSQYSQVSCKHPVNCCMHSLSKDLKLWTPSEMSHYSWCSPSLVSFSLRAVSYSLHFLMIDLTPRGVLEMSLCPSPDFELFSSGGFVTILIEQKLEFQIQLYLSLFHLFFIII